jgi:uncharacterized RDD family membrane protein YckC
MPRPGQPGWHPGVPLPPGSVLVPVQAKPHGYPLASLGSRLLARLIDIAVVFVMVGVAAGWMIYTVIRDYLPVWSAIIRAGVNGEDGSDLVLPAVPAHSGTLFSVVIPLTIMALWWVYEVPAIARTGQTFGKRVMGIRVLALESTEPLGIRRAFRRWNPLGMPVIFWSCFGLGFLLQFIDSISPVAGGPLHLALHDRSAATVVVRSGRRGHEITPSTPPSSPADGGEDRSTE